MGSDSPTARTRDAPWRAALASHPVRPERRSPSYGSHEGGTTITISGRNLVDRAPNGSLLVPRVFLCGAEALQVALHDEASAGVQHMTAVTTRPPVVNTSCAATGGTDQLVEYNRSCHVRLTKEAGRYGEALGAFVFVNPDPKQLPVDLSCGWTLDLAIRVAMRAWPYVLTALVALITLHLGYEISVRTRALQRTKTARLRRAAMSARPQEYAPNESL